MALLKQARKRLVLIALIATGLAALVGAYDVILRALYEASGPYTMDTPFYWAIGRGILNGLIPYRDLFETKPPGIFLLSALSFKIFGTPLLGHVIEALSLLLYPVLFGWQAWRARASALVTMIAVLCGMLIGLYVMERSGEFQVESFGAFFAIAFLFVIASEMTLLRMTVAGLLLLCAAGMKEPFLLTALGGALILCSDQPKRLFQTCVVPLLIAFDLGVTVMWALGYLGPYLTIYLPELLGKEIVEQRGSIWSHLFDAHIVFNDIAAYARGSGLFVILLMAIFLLRPLPTKRRRHTLLTRIVFLFSATYLGVTAVAMKGDFYNHQFVFVAPVIAALMMVFVSSLREWKATSLAFRVCALAAGCALVIATVAQPRSDYAERLRSIREQSSIAKRLARQIDSTLTACGIDRYLFLGMHGLDKPYAYTEHSPLGPNFFQFTHFLAQSRPFFRATLKDNLVSARLIVRQPGGKELNDLRPQVDAYLAGHFSQKPWPCAQRVPQENIPGYTFLYRQ